MLGLTDLPLQWITAYVIVVNGHRHFVSDRHHQRSMANAPSSTVFLQCMFVADAGCHHYCTTEVSRCYSFSCGLCCQDMDAVTGKKPEMTQLSTCESSESGMQPTASCSSASATDRTVAIFDKASCPQKESWSTDDNVERNDGGESKASCWRKDASTRPFLDLFQKMVEKLKQNEYERTTFIQSASSILATLLNAGRD